MQNTPPLLPHLAFYEALAALDESDPAWDGTVAGLLTVRLFDTWCELSRRGERVQAWETAGVEEALNALPENHFAFGPLDAVVSAARSPDAPPAAALRHLGAYARALHFQAQWLLAIDVCTTLLANAEGGSDDLVIATAFQRGYCYRMAGQLDAAAASYDEGRLLAATCGNEAGLLEADVSHAALASHRGNLPRAEALLDGVIARANPATCRRVLARALHNRAGVAARRGKPEDAVVYGYRALALYDAAADRDRTLGDIATALGEAGYYEAAWDGQLLLAVTAQEQEARWVATVNLIELAACRGNERLFHRFREQLAGAALPAALTGHYHLYVGAGYHRFGHRGQAVQELRNAVETAQRYELNEIRLKAEDMLIQIDREPISVRHPAQPPRTEVAEVIAAVREMRELAGVATE